MIMAGHMRLPNGFGQISQIKRRKLRNPWRAMVTVGQDEHTGKYKRKTIGYYKTYNEAYTALLAYHNDPVFLSDKTFLDVYDEWSDYYFPRLKNTKVYETAIGRCGDVYNLKIRDIRAHHVRDLLEQDMPPSSRDKLHQMLSIMFDYAVEYEYMSTNYARLVSSHKKLETHNGHISFTDEEVALFWRNNTDDYISMLLVGIYTGFRPQELMLLETKNINITDWTVLGGMKTESGTDRLVPIHDLIKPLILKWYDVNEKYLFKGHSYSQLYYRLVLICNKYNLDKKHKPHDTRKTFVTKCKRYGVDEYAIKRIVGHKSGDLTEDVYTERDVTWLRNEINKIV